MWSHVYRSLDFSDRLLAEALLAILGTFPTYGTRRVTAQLRRAPYKMRVSQKRVQRVMRQKGWLQAVKQRKAKPTRLPALPQPGERVTGATACPGLGVRYHVHTPGTRRCVPGGDDGCVSSLYPRLGLEPSLRPATDPDSPGAGHGHPRA